MRVVTIVIQPACIDRSIIWLLDKWTRFRHKWIKLMFRQPKLWLTFLVFICENSHVDACHSGHQVGVSYSLCYMKDNCKSTENSDLASSIGIEIYLFRWQIINSFCGICVTIFGSDSVNAMAWGFPVGLFHTLCGPPRVWEVIWFVCSN